MCDTRVIGADVALNLRIFQMARKLPKTLSALNALGKPHGFTVTRHGCGAAAAFTVVHCIDGGVTKALGRYTCIAVAAAIVDMCINPITEAEVTAAIGVA